jgi:hypothetical protein
MTYYQRLHSPVVSPHQKLKLNNFLILDLIFFLINTKNLEVFLQKVKDHNNNPGNDLADNLANTGTHIKDPIIVNHNFFHSSSLGLFKWNNISVIDQNI